jgi:hypothetical protein
MYRCAQCRIDVASVALVRLISKLKNQSEFTQIAYRGGENTGGEVKGDGVDT